MSKNIDFAGVAEKIKKLYENLNEKRSEQLEDIKAVRERIFDASCNQRTWSSNLNLPDLWEQYQTMKAHLIDIIYSHPEGLFDVESEKIEDTPKAIAQKSMLCEAFEKMDLRKEIEKIVDSLITTGESVVFVGWETKLKRRRRWSNFLNNFEIVSKIIYDGPTVKGIEPSDFVFDSARIDRWNNCAKIFKTYMEIEEIKDFKENNLLTPDAEKSILEGVLATKDGKEIEGYKNGMAEILEFWGDIRLDDGRIFKNYLVVVAGRKHVLRFEENPYIETPFIYATLNEHPRTKRGISPLKPILALNEIESKILNKQLDAYSLIVNPPYLAPKGCFTGAQEVSPGKIIEYDSSLLPQMPVPINFSPALAGWDFIQYFKNSIENATGIYRTMAGNVAFGNKTATEIAQSASGQNARINLVIDSINRKIILPMVKKVAETISNFDTREYELEIPGKDEKVKILINDEVRNGNYKYKYSDRKASIERKYKYRELAESIIAFSKIPNFSSKINWKECFKYTLSQLGVENVSKFLTEEGFEENKQNANINFQESEK